MDKRIGILIRSLKPGGAEKQSALLASVLAQHYKVHLFIQYNEISHSNQLLITHPNIKLCLLSGNVITKVKKLRHFIKEDSITHLFAYLSSDNLIASLGALQLKNCVVYGGIRSSELPRHKFIVLRTLHRLMQKGTIFNNYKGMNSFIKQGFYTHKSLVIPNGIEINKATIEEKENGIINILTVGRFVEAKDFKTALQAIDRARKSTKKTIKFYIVGFGSLENKIRDLIHDLELNDCVEVIINPKNVNDYYQLADIYLCTSTFEGLSNSIMEAINFRLPTVATNVGDNNQLVVHNSNGFLTAPYDSVEISNALINLIDNQELRVQFGKNGFSHLDKHYSLEQFAKRYMKLIEN